MSQLRIEKIQEFIKQEISRIILNDLKDPRVGFVTVTRVEVTGDLQHAKIFVSLMGSPDEKKATLQGLQRALGFMRTEIGKRLRLRLVPELALAVDESLDYSVRIQKLLDEIKHNGPGN